MIFRMKVRARKFGFAKLLIGLSMGGGAILAQAQDVSLSTSSFGDTTHFEFSGRTHWNYEFETTTQNKKKIVELRVDELPETEVKKLKGIAGPLIERVVYVPKSPKGFPVLQFVLANQNIEAFDYQTEMPSRYVIDFFYPEGMAIPKAKVTKTPPLEKKLADAKISETLEVEPSVEVPLATVGATSKAKGKTKTRSPALSDAGAQIVNASDQTGPKVALGLFDGGDPKYERFLVSEHEINEEAIILSQENYYVKFPPLDFPLSIHRTLQKNAPIYNIVPAVTEENKEARLVFKLFERKRQASFLKTLQWFRKKYPHSEYLEPMAFMEADTHLSFWEESQTDADFQKMTDLYSALLEKYPQSLMNERTSLLLGHLFLRRKNMPSAVRHFHRHLESEKKYSQESREVAQVALAYALSKLNRFGEAYRLYDELIGSPKTTPAIAAEAKFRKGDVFFDQADFARAAQDYHKAITENPLSVADLPNALFNHGESLFRIGQYKDSLVSYIQHLQKFPSHPHSVYALTRVGEILEILGVNETKVMGAFLETAFRFGDTPSTLVARLRVLTRRMKGMKKVELDKVLKDLAGMIQASPLENIQQFYTVMVSDGLQRRGEYSSAVDLLANYLKAFPSTADRNMLAQRISKNINLEIKKSIHDGNFIKALELESHYANSWLKTSNRLDTQFYVGQAFEQAGVPQRAREYYQNLYNSMQSLKGTAEEKKIKITQALPSQDRVLLRLAGAQFQTEKFKDAFETLKNIQSPENLDFKEQIERVLLITRLLSQKGDPKAATLYLTEVLEEWKAKPADVAPLFLELAQMEKALNEADKALASIQRLEGLWQDSQRGFDEDVMVRALKLKISLLEDEKLRPARQAAIESLLLQFEESRPLGSYRYDLGLMYLENGDLKKAESVWGGFKGEASNSWKKLALDRMSTNEWRDSYKRYIKRIPAMANQKEANP